MTHHKLAADYADPGLFRVPGMTQFTLWRIAASEAAFELALSRCQGVIFRSLVVRGSVYRCPHNR